jgi:hypothetical protein
VSSATYSIKTLTVDGHTGVVGNDLMDGMIAIFDFPCRTVEIRQKPVDVRSITSESVMIQGGSVSDGTQLTLPVTVAGIEGTAYLDTGSRDTRISPSFAAAAHIDPSSPEFRDADLIFGFKSKGTVSRIGPVGSVQFAGITIPHAKIRVMNLPIFGMFRPGNPGTQGPKGLAIRRRVLRSPDRTVWVPR